jgi:putative FmdB family regulatory protein
MPFYDHRCGDCGHEWEDFYSITKCVPGYPEECPKCKAKGNIKRLLSADIGVSVPLTGRELKQSIVKEREKIKKQMAKDENLRANIMGEDNYHNTETNVKKIGEELKQL